MLLIIRKQPNKVKSLIVPHSFRMRYQHFPYLLMVAVKPNQNVLPEGEQGSFIVGAYTASSSAIGYTYMRGAWYWYESRVLLTIMKKKSRFLSSITGWFVRYWWVFRDNGGTSGKENRRKLNRRWKIFSRVKLQNKNEWKMIVHWLHWVTTTSSWCGFYCANFSMWNLSIIESDFLA